MKRFPDEGDSGEAQAVQLVRALRDAIDEMTHRLAWLESRDDSHAHAIRLEAAALRRDIYEAQRHIDRLEHHYYLSQTTARHLHPAPGVSAAAEPVIRPPPALLGGGPVPVKECTTNTPLLTSHKTGSQVESESPFVVLLGVGFVVTYWWLILAALAVVVAACLGWWSCKQSDAADERERREHAALVARADQQHAWVWPATTAAPTATIHQSKSLELASIPVSRTSSCRSEPILGQITGWHELPVNSRSDHLGQIAARSSTSRWARRIAQAGAATSHQRHGCRFRRKHAPSPVGSCHASACVSFSTRSGRLCSAR